MSASPNFSEPLPLIGLTCGSRTGPDWVASAPTRPGDFLFRDYSSGVLVAGGLAALLPVPDRDPVRADLARRILERLDGLILTGGPDVHPRLYGEEPLRGLGEIDHPRDLFEMELVRAAAELEVPVLGICRGVQVINAAFGGTLYQDLATQAPGCLEHAQPASKEIATHRVTINKWSGLRDLVGREEILVASRHHQAVRDVGSGLEVSATADDQVIEALEHPDFPFLIGVQWHPEGLWPRDETSRRLFAALVDAARARSRP